jgi:hypothetical protein
MIVVASADIRTASVLLESARALSAQATAHDDAATWSAAVVVAGAACESRVAAAFRQLSDVADVDPARRAELRELRRLIKSRKPLTLQPKGQRALWRALTTDRLSHWDGWIRYVRHVDRCRALTHTGLLPSGRAPDKRDAAEAIEISQAFLNHIDSIRP